MNNEQARKFVEAVYADIWSGKNVSKFDDYYAKTLISVAYLPTKEIEMDYEACKKLAYDGAENRYKVDTDFEVVIGQNNIITAKYKQRSVNRHTNEVSVFRTAFQYALENNKITKCWAISNSDWNM